MAASLNKVTLLGALGKDPERKSFSNGGSIVNFSIATSETWKDRTTGERKEKTEWHNISVQSEQIGNTVMSYCKKGSRVYIEGKMQTRKWKDKSGEDRYTTEVVMGPFDSKLLLLSPKDDPSGAGRSNDASTGPSRGTTSYQAFEDNASFNYGKETPDGRSGAVLQRVAFGDDLDDDVPFVSSDSALEWRVS